jgi:hypothetical protein
MDKENGNRKEAQRGKSLPKEYKWEDQGTKEKRNKGRATGGIITEVKLGIKEKRQEKGEEEGCMKRKVHIGNNWWKIMTIYSKEMKTTRRRNERKQGRLYTHGRGLQQENRRKRSKKLGREEGVWEEKIQRKDGKCKKGWEILNGNKQGHEEGNGVVYSMSPD